MAPIERKTIDLSAIKKKGLPVFFIVGGPGSGKGTQCAKMVEKYGLTHLSSGDLLRDDVASGSPRGAELKKIMESGQLVALEIVLDLIKEAMLKNQNSKGFLIDGYPREIKQGTQFENEVLPCNLVIYFDVSDDTMTKRLLGRAKTSGRVDDNAETIKKRLKTFHDQTEPVIAYYKDKGKLVTIKAEGTVDEIFQQTQKPIEDVLSKVKSA